MSALNVNTEGLGVEVRALFKSFDGQPVLRDISLDVAPGEVFVIMGPSGSGKSVLLKHIIGLAAPDRGEVRVGGHAVGTTGVMNQYRQAMVFQSGALLNSLTVGENVGLYLSEHRLRRPTDIKAIVEDKLSFLGLKGMQDRFPSELSGGMKKRVAIARALVIEPQLLLYDEPTSELDPVMAVTIGKEILDLNRRIHVTSIVVTHDRELAFGIADHMAIIMEGQILEQGPPETVRQSGNARVQEFLRAEFRWEELARRDVSANTLPL